MECQTSPWSTRDAGSSPVLRSLIDGTPALVFGFVLTVVSACITIDGGRVAIKNSSAACQHFIDMDVLAFSIVGAVASALASITFRRRSLPKVAHVLEDVAVVFLGPAFASLASVLIREQFQWFAYVLCMIPAIPLLRRPWQSLSGCLVASVRILAALVAGWFHGGEPPVQTGDDRSSV